MDIKLHEKQGYYVVYLKGSLDMYTSVELKSQTDSIPLKTGEKIILQLNQSQNEVTCKSCMTSF